MDLSIWVQFPVGTPELDNTPGGYILGDMGKVKQKLIRRLKIVAGQVGGLQEMIEKDVYCIDVITQVEAVRQALSSVKNVILENHLSTHLVHQMKHGEEKKAIDEVLKVYRLGQN